MRATWSIRSFFVCLCSDGHLIFCSMRRQIPGIWTASSHISGRQITIFLHLIFSNPPPDRGTGRPGGCLVVLDYCAGQKELSETFQEHIHRWRGLPVNGGSSWARARARARARAIQCYSMLFSMKCMAGRSYLEVLEFPHWEWGGIQADLFF